MHLSDCRLQIHRCEVKFSTCGLVYELRLLWFQDVVHPPRISQHPTGATDCFRTILPPASSHHQRDRVASTAAGRCPFDVWLRPPSLSQASTWTQGHISSTWMQSVRDCTRLLAAVRQQVSLSSRNLCPILQNLQNQAT